MAPRLISISTLAAISGTPARTLRALLADGVLRGVHAARGRKWRVPIDEAARFAGMSEAALADAATAIVASAAAEASVRRSAESAESALTGRTSNTNP